MKYKVVTTVNGRENGHVYETREAAVKTWDRLREVYTRAGYTIADAAGESIDRDGLAELWIREGRAARNIEIWPTVDGETPATPADIESEAETITAAPAADLSTVATADSERERADRADRTHAADFLTAQKFANEAAAELADLLTIDENRAVHLLTTAAGVRIFEVTHGRAESVRTAARHAADKIAAALNIEAAAAADLLAEVLTYWHNNMIITDEDTTTAAEVISESESADTTTAPAADSLAAKVADVARVWLLCCCLAAAPAAADSIETDTPADVCELLTADPLAQVAEFAAAGLTVSHVTIKSLPAREIPAADVPALLTC